MWTEPERKIAADLLKNPEVMEFLVKLYSPDRTAIRTELEAMVGLSDEQYGSLMRSLALAEKHFQVQHGNINRIAERKATISSPIAPK